MANLANGGAGNGNRTRAGNSRDVSGRDSRTAPHASGGPEATPRHRVTRRVRTPDAGSPDRGPRGAGARGPVADFFVRLVREKPLGLVGAAIILLLLVCGIFADVLTRYEVDEIIVMDRLAPPSAKHLLGADGAGRDILTRLIHGARISLVVGLAATTVTIVVAAAIGVPSGYLGGRYDIVVQRFVDGWMAFPGLLVLLTVMSIVGRGTLQIIVVLGILYGIHNSRVLRSAVIVIKENDYIAAAAATGNRKLRTVLRHVLPNIVAPVIIIYSINIGYIVLDEAALSFLGFGLPLEVPSWGGMLSGDGRRYMERKPELALFPGICLAVVVYGVNMFGDAVRDLLDPRLKGGGGRALGVYRSPSRAVSGERRPRTRPPR